MVAIKRKMLQAVNSVIVLVISLLGFTTSCVEDPEYGTPTASYSVRGKVESAVSHQPIPDIIVEMRVINEQDDEPGRLADTGFSYNGDFHVELYDWPRKDYTFQLKFTDTDGALNGEYESLDTTVVFNDSKYTGGDGSWYSGYVEKEINIQLNPKE